MSTVNYNEDMRKAFPDKELKQPKKQDVVDNKNNNNKMEDNNMENLNVVKVMINDVEVERQIISINTVSDEVKSLYQISIDGETEDERNEANEKLNQLNYAVVEIEDEDGDEDYLLIQIEENKNINNKENDNMKNIAKIVCVNNDMLNDIEINIINELQAEFGVNIPHQISNNTIELDADFLNTNELLAVLIGFEIDYRIQKMESSYAGLKMENLHYRERYAKSRCAIFTATTKKKIDFYEENLRGQQFVKFNAIKVKELENNTKEYKAVTHFVVYDIPVGEKPELKKRIKSNETIVKTIGHVKKVADRTTYAATTFVNEMADLSDNFGKLGGAVTKATMKIATNIGHELSTSFMEGLNDSLEGKTISEKDKRRHATEKARLMNNLATLKAKFSNNDEDDDF